MRRIQIGDHSRIRCWPTKRRSANDAQPQEPWAVSSTPVFNSCSMSRMLDAMFNKAVSHSRREKSLAAGGRQVSTATAAARSRSIWLIRDDRQTQCGRRSARRIGKARRRPCLAPNIGKAPIPFVKSRAKLRMPRRRIVVLHTRFAPFAASRVHPL